MPEPETRPTMKTPCRAALKTYSVTLRLRATAPWLARLVECLCAGTGTPGRWLAPRTAVRSPHESVISSPSCTCSPVVGQHRHAARQYIVLPTLLSVVA